MEGGLFSRRFADGRFFFEEGWTEVLSPWDMEVNVILWGLHVYFLGGELSIVWGWEDNRK
jgi:hypothetical protein